MLALLVATLGLGACGAGSTASAPPITPAGAAAGDPPAARRAAAAGVDWPEFGAGPQRPDASDAPTGIRAADLGRLRRVRVALPGAVDSAPIYLHGVTVAATAHDVFVATTAYGQTLAIDASSGQILWRFTPQAFNTYAGTAQITNTSPLADPDRRFVYAASPDGLIHKLALSDGHEQAGWPVSVTRDPVREKLGGALNIAGGAVIAVTSGYLGDQPPYQGHVVTIARSSGRVLRVFNTLCADRRRLIVPSSCSSSDSAILARGGAVVEPGGRRLLVATGNGPYDGRTDFGDSVIELDTATLRLRQAYTPTNQAELNATDADLGSSAPALLPGGLVLAGGKDGILRLLDLSRLDGRSPGRPARTGGELQQIRGPGGADLFSAPAVWHHTVFVANGGGTAAYTVSGRRLHLRWSAPGHGSSPVVAGGLLWVYDVDAGKLDVYLPSSGRLLAGLDAGPGHWNSPVIAGGRIALPEGNANDHGSTGVLDLYTVT
jgi:hypothetical protein